MDSVRERARELLAVHEPGRFGADVDAVRGGKAENELPRHLAGALIQHGEVLGQPFAQAHEHAVGGAQVQVSVIDGVERPGKAHAAGVAFEGVHLGERADFACQNGLEPRCTHGHERLALLAQVAFEAAFQRALREHASL